jgi:putative heme-binding domain-containing protein
MRTHSRVALSLVLVLTLHPSPAPAAEKWADPKLPVADGLELWLDATRIAAASGAGGASPPREGGAVAVWHDGSGNKRDARQDAPARRPVFRTDMAGPQAAPVVQFDGRDDGFLADVPGIDLKDFTVFVVASPFSNHGTYRAMLSANVRGQNDYTTGFNIDQGNAGTGQFDRVNAEGRGFPGERDLLSDDASFPFGTFHVLALTGDAGGAVRLAVDARPQAARPRGADPIEPDELRVGYRFANPAPGRDGETGFFDGAIAEVLVYGRALSDTDRAKVEQYLRAKHAPLLALKGVPPKPPVQMLVPGFTVRELPVKLPNLTAIRYGPDGRLYGAGYDGRMHVLSDTDGDGLEDKAEVLWDKPTFRTPMAFTWSPDGTLYVTSNGKITALRDTNGDGKPDTDQVINTGWPPDAGFTGGGVDAMGLVFDKDGNFYFGLGCTLFANAYLVDDKTGVSRYDIRSERGTILKVSPDGKKREIVCTGIRFPVGLAMNRLGDLFCSDQEGATWLPGGNPLDELNHIVPGRHYGFPPRHDKYLPDVVDEPPAVTFGPQHQSTCGLIFNEPSGGRGAFGPKAWEDNAIVCGYSRGKLWRVPMAKTDAGYVGRPVLLAGFRVLTLEPAIDPQGNLTVITHSGEPDWGTGPGGPGRLFEIAYTDRAAPQPVVAWAEGPTDVRVAFDRAVESGFLGDLSKVNITYGEFVRAGDRYEVLRPPYAVVDQQLRAHRGDLRVTAAKLSDDRCTLLLTTDPHPAQAWYALSVPLAGGPAADGTDRVIELDYDLTGVEATWTPEGSDSPAWAGWLPHGDLQVSRALARGSAQHDALFQMAEKGKGKLVVTPGREEPSVHVSYRNPPGRGAVPLDGRYPAWVPTQLPPPPPTNDSAAGQLAGGDWKRGEALFFGAEANCATCHVIRGKGGHVGPDLSNLPHRDLASLYRDITEPNAVINPDHRGYTAVLKSGQVLSGLVRSDSEDKLRIYDTAGKEVVVPRSEVSRLRADAISIMPEGYAKLGQEKIKDLLAFLTNATPQAAAQNLLRDAPAKPLKEGRVRESGGNRPPPARTRAEVDAVLAGSEKADGKNLRPLRILLVAGPKDHGPGEHDYPQWQKDWTPLLKKLPKVEVSTAFGPPEDKHWESADLVVFYCWGPQFWNEASYRQLEKFQARGGGVVLLHSATIAEKDPEQLARHVGVCYRSLIKFRHGPLDLNVPPAAADHPVMRGFGVVHHVDESYWPHVGGDPVTVLATTPEEGQERPMVWSAQRGRGRSFGTLLGHYTWTFDDPLARLLILRGMAWAAGEPAGRFESVATDGVELKESK